MSPTMSRFLGVLGLALALLVAGCGSQPPAASHPSTTPPPVATAAAASASPTAPTAAPSSAPLATKADVEAVARQIYVGSNPMGRQCTSGCPVTQRLVDRIMVLIRPNPGGPGPGDPWCGCQNPPDSFSIQGEPTTTGGTAHVTLNYGDKANRLDLVEVWQDGRLLADDLRCTGRGEESSIYNVNGVNCLA
jgi:hypothetical protein